MRIELPARTVRALAAFASDFGPDTALSRVQLTIKTGTLTAIACDSYRYARVVTPIAAGDATATAYVDAGALRRMKARDRLTVNYPDNTWTVQSGRAEPAELPVITDIAGMHGADAFEPSTVTKYLDNTDAVTPDIAIWFQNRFMLDTLRLIEAFTPKNDSPGVTASTADRTGVTGIRISAAFGGPRSNESTLTVVILPIRAPHQR